MTWLMLLPFFLWSRLPLSEFSSFTAPSQLLALVPGLFGIILRRVWYQTMLRACGTNLTVDWLAVIRTRDSEVGDRCTFGVANWIGWVSIGDDVITGSHVILLSGAHQHAFDDFDRPMRCQRGDKRQLSVESDVWIGAQAVIMADISTGTVVGAGSVVTRTYREKSVIVGNPARVLRPRGSVKHA
jgi:virginiamycin A acetyltransferase